MTAGEDSQSRIVLMILAFNVVVEEEAVLDAGRSSGKARYEEAEAVGEEDGSGKWAGWNEL